MHTITEIAKKVLFDEVYDEDKGIIPVLNKNSLLSVILVIGGVVLFMILH